MPVIEVRQENASLLKATVSPSGDMARKAFYDRNASTHFKAYGATVSAGTGWTVVYTYTVPTGKIIWINPVYFNVRTAIATDGKIAGCTLDVYDLDAETYRTIAQKVNYYGGPKEMTDTLQIQLYLKEGQAFRGKVKNEDTIDHWINNHVGYLEFDA